MNIFYPSQGSFLDPQFRPDGKLYAPERFKEIVKEQYFISKSINTSFTDVDHISPRERELLIQYINESNQASLSAYSEQVDKNKK